MAGGGYLRVSDDDRERVVGILREQTADGRLTPDEFEERMSAAYAAKTWDDLLPLARDLPVDIGFPGERQRPRRPDPPERVREPRDGFPVRRAALLAPLLVCPAIWLIIAFVVGHGGPAVAPLVIGAFIWLRMWSRGSCGPVRSCGGRAPGR
ncbi:MAG: DUF1707 SHOCT-like domain-containing protein [Streptosporangiaceae bacterium]